MLSTCSELTPRAPIPDGRMAQIMQPWLNNNDCDYEVSFRGMIQKYKYNFFKERNNNESGYEVGFRSIIRKYEPLLHIASSAQTISGQEGHKRKLL